MCFVVSILGILDRSKAMCLYWADQHVFKHEDEFFEVDIYSRIRTIGSGYEGMCVSVGLQR